MVDLNLTMEIVNLAMEIANGNAIGMAIKAMARIVENLIMEAKTKTTEERIVVEGHLSIHTNFVSLIKRKDTMSLSAEKLHETKMATTATTMAMEMEMATASLIGRLDQRLISRILLNLNSFPYSANTINHIVNVTRFIDINST